jgi:integrase
MGRKRVNNLGLPPRLYKRGPSYYFDQRPGWLNLGRDYYEALAKYAKLMARKSRRGTVGELLDEYFLRYLPKHPIEPGTLKSYRNFAEHIRREWGEQQLHEVRRGDAQRFVDVHPYQAMAGNAMRWFAMVMGLAQSWDWIEANPLDGIKYRKQPKRMRTISDAEYGRIYAELPRKLQILMDLAYILSARVSEVAGLRWDDVKDGVLHMRRPKNKDTQPFIVTPELQALFDECRRLETTRTLPVVSPYMLTNERRKPFHPHRVSVAFAHAAARAGITDVVFHDIRRSSANAERKTAQDRLGHASASTTRIYLTGKDPVMPLTKKRYS